MISLFNFLVIASCLSVTHGMNCNWRHDSNNIFSNVINTCPRIIDDSSKSYCCLDTHGEFYCCNFFEFAATYLIIGAVVLVALSIISSLICCFCCPCCFCYKRRHGTVIGPPQVTQVYVPPPGQNAGAPYSAYSSPYTQQSPYNPHYS